MSVSPLQQFFADELRRAREAAGMTQEQLATKMYVSKSLVAMVETGQRAPRRDFATAVDDALGADGRFDRMRERLLRGEATPEWFRPWVDYEQHATTIRAFEPNVVPGLLQTEEYARALTGDEDATAARLARQRILDQDTPPEVFDIIDESVLHRQIGTLDVMCKQMMRLAEAPVGVQILPTGADSYLGVDGSFELATVDGRECVYVHTPARGFVLDSDEIISAVRHRWDVIRGEALPQRQSRELILKAAERWKNDS